MPIKLPFRPRRDGTPSDLWTQCPGCAEMIYNKQLERTQRVCTRCGHHFRLRAAERIETLVDPGSFREESAELASVDPLGFVDRIPYAQRLAEEQQKTGMLDAAVTGRGFIRGRPVAPGAPDSQGKSRPVQRSYTTGGCFVRRRTMASG